MKYSNKLIPFLVVLFISTAWGEKLVYSAGFRFFDAGEAVFTSQESLVKIEYSLLQGQP